MGRILCWILAYTTLLELEAECFTPSVARCSRYVEEGDTLTCTCTPGDCTNSQVTVTWLNQSPASDTLEQTNVSREDNGTQFTCQMVCGGETSNVTYTLQVGYGPSEENVFILGNSTLITDGSRLLNLTCVATEVNPAPVYSWLDPLCQANSQGSTCSFTPQIPWDDNQTLICRVTDNFRDNPFPTTKEVALNLTYPPTETPRISGYTPGQIVKTGDTLTCTVTGGKPLVSDVMFYCLNPEHNDQNDTRLDTSVCSSLVIDTSQATGEDMICNCSATWAPQIEFYTLTEVANIPVSYAAFIVNFTVSGQTDSLTVNESDRTQLLFSCNVSGVPGPKLAFTKHTGDDLEFLRGRESTDDAGYKTMTYTIVNATCEDIGTYSCFADNNFAAPDRESIQVNVQCAPRPSKEGFPNAPDSPPELTEEGLSFALITNPVPGPFRYLRFESSNDTKGATAPVGMFQETVTQTHRAGYLVSCRIQPVTVTRQDLGVYCAEVSNGLGSFQYYFAVQKAVNAPTTPAETGDHDTVPVAAAVGGVFGGLVVLTSAVVVAVLLYKRNYRKYEEPLPRIQDSNHYTGLRPSQGRDPRLSSGYADIESCSKTEDETNRTRVNTESTNAYEEMELRPKSTFYSTLNTSSLRDNHVSPAVIRPTSQSCSMDGYEIPEAKVT